MLKQTLYKHFYEAEENADNNDDKTEETQNNQIKNLINDFADSLRKEYSNVFKTVPTSVRDDFEAINIRFTNIKTKDEYVIAIENLKDIVCKYYDFLRIKRIEVLNKLFNNEKYKNNIERLRKQYIDSEIELNIFRETNTYKELSSAIDQIFSTIESSVDFESIKVKNGKDGLEKLAETVREKSFYGIKETDKTENFIGSEFTYYIDNISSSKRNPEKKIKETDIINGEMPKQLSALIKKCFNGLNDVDKTVLKHFVNNSPYSSFNGSDGIPMRGITSLMTDPGIVCLCGVACDKAFPVYSKEEADPDELEEGEDVVFELKSISYKGGSSNARIHYDQMNAPGNLGQFFELRVSPSVKVRSEKGRAAIVLKAPKSEEDDKMVTKHGKYMSVLETIKLMLQDDDQWSGSKKRWGR